MILHTKNPPIFTQISTPTKRDNYNRLAAEEKIRYFKIRKTT